LLQFEVEKENKTKCLLLAAAAYGASIALCHAVLRQMSCRALQGT
jgi:hypothetical protein